MITPSADGASASLSFKLPPDYEMPGDSAVDASNTYKVVVVAADDAPGAVVDADAADDIRKKTYHKLTVVVTDEDEDGSISLSALQPQVDVGLTATLMDDDAADSDEDAGGKQIEATWKWEQASAMSGPWTLISGADSRLVHARGGCCRHVPPCDGYLRRQVTAMTRPPWRCRPMRCGRCPLEATLRPCSWALRTDDGHPRRR